MPRTEFSYDATGERLSIATDADMDGIADRRVEPDNAPGGRRLGTVVTDGEGVIEVVYRYENDPVGNAILAEIDELGDGTIDAVALYDYACWSGGDAVSSPGFHAELQAADSPAD